MFHWGHVGIVEGVEDGVVAVLNADVLEVRIEEEDIDEETVSSFDIDPEPVVVPLVVEEPLSVEAATQ